MARRERNRVSRRGKTNLPGNRIGHTFPAHPGIAGDEFRLGRAGGHRYLELHRLAPYEFAEPQLRIRPVREEKRRDIDTGDVHAIEIAVIVRTAEIDVVPCLVVVTHQQAYLQMHVRPRPVQSRTGVTHASEHRSRIHRVPDLRRDLGKVRIDGIDLRFIPLVLHDHIFPVIAASRDQAGMDDLALRDAHHQVQRIARLVPLHRGDVDSLVETGHHHLAAHPDRRPHVTERPALPWLCRLTLKDAVHIHVELCGITSKEMVVLGGKGKFDWLRAQRAGQ